MASAPPSDRRNVSSPNWVELKRWLWLFGSVVPGLVFASWLAVRATGLGVFWWAGPIFIFGIMPVFDHIVGPDDDKAPDSTLAWLETDPFYRWVAYLYLPSQFLSLIFACWLWAGGGWLTMTVLDKLGVMMTVGIIGGAAINVAHVLGHTRMGPEKWLSKVALAQTCYGHFFVEHNRGHHVRVATAEDPASSRLGESLYRFIPRSVVGSLQSAWDIEGRRLQRRGRSRWSIRNDVLNAWIMSLAVFVVLVVWFGVVVLPWLAGQAVIGFCMLETVNYIEHYGLRRQKLPNGRYERVRASHSWNSNTVIANVFLFQLQRHSEHHARPLRAYQVLSHTQEAPQLPTGYGSMMPLALIPPLWRHIMDQRVLDHYGGDIRLAAVSPRLEKRLLQRYLPTS